MPFVGSQIIDEFVIYDQNLQPVTGETFSGISLWVNGTTSNVSISISGSSVSAGFYQVSFIPNLSGSWFLSFVGSPSGKFNASYDVMPAPATSVNIDYSLVWSNSGTGNLSAVSAYNIGQVWTNSGSAVLLNLSVSTNNLGQVWIQSGTSIINTLTSVSANNIGQVWTNSGTSLLNSLTSTPVTSVSANNLNQVWSQSGTAILNSLTTSPVTSVSANNLNQVWVQSGTALLNNLTSVSAYNIGQVWTNSGTSVLNSLSITAQIDVSAVASAVAAAVSGVITNTTGIAAAVWSTPLTASSVSGTFGGALGEVFKINRGKWEMAVPNTLTLFDEDGTTVIRRFNLFDLSGSASLTGVVKRVPV